MVVRVLDLGGKPTDMKYPLRRNNAVLRQVTAQGVDRLRPLPDQKVSGLEHHARGLLLGALHRYEAYRRAPCRFGDRLGVGYVVLLPLHERIHVSRLYWRVAFEPDWGDHSIEVGTFGLKSNVQPLRTSGAGTDSFTDFGVDAQYQYIGDPHAVTFRAAWIHESHNLGASRALGFADNSRDILRSYNASLSYIYDRTWSFTVSRLAVGGTTDATLYGTVNGSPNSSS